MKDRQYRQRLNEELAHYGHKRLGAAYRVWFNPVGHFMCWDLSRSSFAQPVSEWVHWANSVARTVLANEVEMLEFLRRFHEPLKEGQR